MKGYKFTILEIARFFLYYMFALSLHIESTDSVISESLYKMQN